MLDCLGEKTAFQGDHSDVSHQWPSLHSHRIESPLPKLVFYQPTRKHRKSKASAYQALNCIRSPHVH